MQLIDIIQTFCRRTGLPSPGTIVDSADRQINQLVALTQEVAETLTITPGWTWQALTREAVFTTVAADTQGLIATIAPFGCVAILKDTIFNRSLRMSIYGPLYAQDWQALKTFPVTGPLPMYRIVEGELKFLPQPAAGNICAFEYSSDYFVRRADGTYFNQFLTDTDEFVLDPRLLLAGLRWRWKEEKGLDAKVEYDIFRTMADGLTAQDGTKKTLNMADGTPSFQPGVFVPQGNWAIHP